jgi:hypothetical protein
MAEQILPEVYRKSSDYSVNYNFTDVEEGTGVVVFYAGKGTSSNVLSNKTFYSNRVSTWLLMSSQVNYTKDIDVDFDVVFNMPKDAKGKAILSVPWGFEGLALNNNYRAYVIARIRKWDGATETEIASVQSETINYTPTVGMAIKKHFMSALDITVPLTHYKAGETLRLTIEVWCYNSFSGAYIILAHDPMNRVTSDLDGLTPTGLPDWTGYPTNLILNMPFRIN